MADDRRRFRSFLAVISWEGLVLGILGCLGAGTIIAGVVIGWQSENATPVLIAGIALVSAVFVLWQWREITLKYRDWEATILRREVASVLKRLANVNEKVTSEPNEARSEIENAKEAAQQLLAFTETEWRPFSFGHRRLRRHPSTLGANLASHIAWHEKRGGDQVRLSIMPVGKWTIARPRCEVKPSTGGMFACTLMDMVPGNSLVEVSYPLDFPGAPALEPGFYDVTWWADSELLAQDQFTYP